VRTPLLVLIAAVGLVTFDKANSQAAAQQAPAADQASSSSASSSAAAHQAEVVITGKRELTKKINTFVNQLTDFDAGDPARGLARWEQHVCPLVAGLPAQYGEYILARLSDIAQAAGAPLAGRHCHPNLFIVVTTQPQTLLQGLEQRHRSVVFGSAAPTMVNDFIGSPRPVRTWYNTEQRTAEGLPLAKMSFSGISSQYAVPVKGGEAILAVSPSSSDAYSFAANPWSQASHLTLNVVLVIDRAFVIVDPTRFKGVTLGQLADYVAMSGLAQIKSDARLGDAPSILTLFERAPQAASAGLTDWDRAFLRALYKTEHKSILQRREIALEMVRAMAP
jgi:hypothetical protein